MLKHMAALPWSKECGREMIMAVKAKMKVIVLKSSAAASIKKKKKNPKNKMLKFQLCHYLVLTLSESFKFFETWFLPL